MQFLRVLFGDLRVAFHGVGADRRWFWAALPWTVLSKLGAGVGSAARRPVAAVAA